MTYKNTSGADATDFSLATTNGPRIADAGVYKPAGPGNLGTARISNIPPAGTFPTASVDLTLFMKVGDGSKATAKIGFPKGMMPTLDPTKTGFTNASGTVVSSDLLTMAPQIMNMGGGKFEVVLTNVNGSAVNVTNVAIMFNDPGNPNLLDTWTPGGTSLSTTQPTNPIIPGGMLEYTFSANPNLTVSVSDVVALTSSPTDTFFDLAATVPEPSSIVLIAIGSVIVIGYPLLRRR
jgi:hypothetical protein